MSTHAEFSDLWTGMTPGEKALWRTIRADDALMSESAFEYRHYMRDQHVTLGAETPEQVDAKNASPHAASYSDLGKLGLVELKDVGSHLHRLVKTERGNALDAWLAKNRP